MHGYSRGQLQGTKLNLKIFFGHCWKRALRKFSIVRRNGSRGPPCRPTRRGRRGRRKVPEGSPPPPPAKKKSSGGGRERGLNDHQTGDQGSARFIGYQIKTPPRGFVALIGMLWGEAEWRLSHRGVGVPTTPTPLGIGSVVLNPPPIPPQSRPQAKASRGQQRTGKGLWRRPLTFACYGFPPHPPPDPGAR